MKVASIAVLGVTAVVFGAGAPAYGQGKNPPGVNPTHYQCYRVDKAKPMKAITVTLKDQFGAAKVQVIQPVYLCSPTAKNEQAPKDPDTHFLCYEDKGVKAPNKKVHLINQFGEQDLVVGVPFLLCVPTIKKLL